MADLFSIVKGYTEIFVIGGGVVFKEFLFNKIHLTEVYAPHVRGDTFFRKKFDMRSWKLESEMKYPASDNDEYPFVIKVLRKRDETTFRHRTRSLARFFTVDKNLADWEALQLSRLKLPRLNPGARWPEAGQLEFPNIRQRIVYKS
jgi:hypothetical protein